MAALSGLAQQQTSFAVALGEMKLRKQMQDDMVRQAIIDNLVNYLRQSYEKRHAEARQKTLTQQAMVTRGASVAGAIVAAPLTNAAFGSTADMTGFNPAAFVADEGGMGFGGVSSFQPVTNIMGGMEA